MQDTWPMRSPSATLNENIQPLKNLTLLLIPLSTHACVIQAMYNVVTNKEQDRHIDVTRPTLYDTTSLTWYEDQVKFCPQ